MKRQAGFTLVELMIVIVVLGILAAIAVPAYNQHVIRSKLVAATTGLAEYRVRLEQYYQDNRNYGTAGATPCGTAGPPQNPTYPTSQFFLFSCTVGATNQTFIARASSVAGQGLGAVNDYVYTINEQGQRGTTTYAGSAVALTEWKTK